MYKSLFQLHQKEELFLLFVWHIPVYQCSDLPTNQRAIPSIHQNDFHLSKDETKIKMLLIYLKSGEKKTHQPFLEKS